MDSLGVKGVITIYEGDKKEFVLARYENAFLDEGKKKILDLWSGTISGGSTYDYLVIGDGENPGSLSGDVLLANELFKKPISSLTKIYPNRLIIDTYIETSEANFTWTEIGLTSGGAWGIPNSGVLLNKAVINEVKNSLKSKTISWEITLG